MKKIITLLLGTFLCVLSFAENNSSAIIYAETSFNFYKTQNAILNIHPNYSSCSPIELSYDDIKNTKFVIQNGGGITIRSQSIENNQEGIIYSNDYIKLSSGFHAKAGCNLHIVIKNKQL